MLAGCTKNTHRRKPRSSSWLERDFVHHSRPQVPRSQKREEKFDSYCLFHVAPDATLFKMFPSSWGLKHRPDADIFPRDRTGARIAGRASRSCATFRAQRASACRSWMRRWVFSLRNGATIPEEKFPRHRPVNKARREGSPQGGEDRKRAGAARGHFIRRSLSAAEKVSGNFLSFVSRPMAEAAPSVPADFYARLFGGNRRCAGETRYPARRDRSARLFSSNRTAKPRSPAVSNCRAVAGCRSSRNQVRKEISRAGRADLSVDASKDFAGQISSRAPFVA